MYQKPETSKADLNFIKKKQQFIYQAFAKSTKREKTTSGVNGKEQLKLSILSF